MSENNYVNSMVLSRERTTKEKFLTVLSVEKHSNHARLTFWKGGEIALTTTVDAVTFYDFTKDKDEQAREIRIV